jgi:cytidine deaminase
MTMRNTAPPRAMIVKARAIMARAYAPYSRFRVGAVLRGANGRLYAGCNVENAAYPQGWCAEASAIAAMVADGETRIVEAVVMGSGTALCTPCGGCRQKLNEFADGDLPIHVCGPQGLRRSVSLGELLPLSFGPANLKRRKARR